MSTGSISAIIGGLIIGLISYNASRKHRELNDHLESTPLPDEANVVEITSTDLTSEQKSVQIASKADAEEERKKYIIEQKMEKAYEIWHLRKKVLPIAWSVMGGSVVLCFLAKASLVFLILGLVGFLGATFYSAIKIGSKNFQYNHLVEDLKKEGYSHSDLKAQFRTWYYNLG